uniref:NADH dehydrogenase subunit 4 n=1 Tax=Sorineuchora bivitta TaxID=1928793 RepID=UPI0027A4D5FB|nr:NADH dehydrogenase subunit 4 [Sorineuchora bivitta]WGO57751.1 NADH dehydrogenase subunit 4 [Sorineuchora bivitta]
MMSFMLFMMFLLMVVFCSCWWLIYSLICLLTFMFLFSFSYYGLWGGINSYFGCDYVSFSLILLSMWICSLMILSSESINFKSYFPNLFLFTVLVLLLMLYCVFISMNMLTFYFFFEASLIPTLFLILGWGYQPERLQAGIYMLFYTLLASLPMLVSILYIYVSGVSLVFSLGEVVYGYSVYFYLSMIFAFLVKIPMFLVHLWLPKAHVEAPVAGSMILAGVLLKLGGYGILRFMLMMMSLGVKYNYMWISISLVGGSLISMVCLRQIDLKSLIAYSSVSHMGLVIGGLMTLYYWGFCGSYILMVGHGLCSSGLFCLANITYERLGSRNLLVTSGLMNFMPSMCLWWFLLCSCNMSAPPSLNLLGEISLINSLIGWSWLTLFSISILSFFGAVYTLYMYSYSQHGMPYSGVYSCSLGYTREFLLLFLHWFPLNFLVLSGSYFVPYF